jgi:prepilin-type N-terminal cleavage/methylation domain-containing protein
MAQPAREYSGNTGRRSEAGMTLLEVLAALGILVILLTVLSQILHTGSRMWVKNGYAYQNQHQLQDLYTTLAPELRSAYTNPFLAGPACKGDEREVSFWRETGSGLQQVTYRYDAYAKTLYRSAGFWGQRPEFQALFTDLTAWKFAYFEAGTRNWKNDWEPAVKTELPSILRITAATGSADLGSITIPLEAGDEKDER